VIEIKYKKHKVLPFFFLSAFLLSNFCYGKTKVDTKEAKEKILLSEGEEFFRSDVPVEVCHELKRLDTISYTFTSPIPVDFNIHYHIPPSYIINLVDLKNIQSVKEELVVKFPDEHKETKEICLMWEGRSRDGGWVYYKLEKIQWVSR